MAMPPQLMAAAKARMAKAGEGDADRVEGDDSNFIPKKTKPKKPIKKSFGLKAQNTGGLPPGLAMAAKMRMASKK